MPLVKPFLAIGTILVTAGLITATPAGAQTKDQKAGARAAADAGGDAFDAGKYAEAADLFERAERLMHAPPHLLYAARAHAKLGHLVEARELYLTLTRDHLPDSASRVFRDAQTMGEKELADIEPRLPYVSVVVQGGGGASDVHVTKNGEPVPAELLGVPTPVNPGDYSYQALAEGMESTATTVKFREGVRETVVLTLRDIPGYVKKKPSAPAVADGTGASVGSSSPTTSPPRDSAPSSGGRPLLIGSIAGFGVAAVGGILGTVFIVKWSDTNSKSNQIYDGCNPTGTCTPDQIASVRSYENDARSQSTIAIASYVTSGVGLAAGITLLILDQSRNNTVARTGVTPIVGLNYVGVAGRF
jgi:hypothetical protein